jgi:hypothetical protein
VSQIPYLVFESTPSADSKTFNKSGELLAVLVAVATRPLLARSLVFTFATLLTTHSASLQLAYTPLLYGILG